MKTKILIMKPNKIVKPIPVAENKRQVSKGNQENKKGDKKNIKIVSRKSILEPGHIHSAKKKYTGGDILANSFKIKGGEQAKLKNKVKPADPKENKNNDPVADDPNENRSQDDSNPTKNDPATQKGL